MKKTLLKLLLCVTLLAVICFGGCSCGSSSWDGSKVTLKTITNEVGVQGGMVAETENYVYFINGKADADGLGAYTGSYISAPATSATILAEVAR